MGLLWMLSRRTGSLLRASRVTKHRFTGIHGSLAIVSEHLHPSGAVVVV